MEVTLRLTDDAEHGAWRSLGIEATAAGIDYLLGDPARRGGGLGPVNLRAATREASSIRRSVDPSDRRDGRRIRS